MKVAASRNKVPIEKETREATKEESTDCRKREFAAVCIGVNTPKKKIVNRYIIIYYGRSIFFVGLFAVVNT